MKSPLTKGCFPISPCSAGVRRQVERHPASSDSGGRRGCRDGRRYWSKAIIQTAETFKKPLLPLCAFSGASRAAWPAARTSLSALGLSEKTIETLEKGFEATVIVEAIRLLLRPTFPSRWGFIRLRPKLVRAIELAGPPEPAECTPRRGALASCALASTRANRATLRSQKAA